MNDKPIIFHDEAKSTADQLVREWLREHNLRPALEPAVRRDLSDRIATLLRDRKE